MAVSVETEKQWPIPDGLSAKGLAAARAIREFLEEKDATYHGGGGKFYTPEEWEDRGEEYGLRSLLIITHDGGDHAPAFNIDYEAEELQEELTERLRSVGVYPQLCTCWYSAIYAAR